MKKLSLQKKMLFLEAGGFIAAIFVVWVMEIFDFSSFLTSSEPTPMNWLESIIESVIIGFFGVILLVFSNNQLKKMKKLEGLLPICSSCKKIRDDKGYWKQVENYVAEHSDAGFSHTICEECAEKLYGDQGWFQKMKFEKKDSK